jgi:riboflavin kinase / FMN adenylyltransferase
VRVVAGLDAIEPSSSPAFLVVGVFDGLHRGHAYLLAHLVEEAARRSAIPVVITFDHHPDEILVGSAPPILCDPEERLGRLAAAGVAMTVVVHFDQALRETTYDDFVDRVATRITLDGFLMTPDAAFGYRRAGTPDALAALGSERGFDVVVVPSFELDGGPVSSSRIRADIAAGDLEAADRLLGRPHAVVGDPEAAGEGTRLRFPLPVALPPDGGYRARVGPVSTTQQGSSRSAEHDAEAAVSGGAVVLPDERRHGRTRVAFLGRL